MQNAWLMHKWTRQSKGLKLKWQRRLVSSIQKLVFQNQGNNPILISNIFISFKAVRAEFMRQQADQIAHTDNLHLYDVGLKNFLHILGFL